MDAYFHGKWLEELRSGRFIQGTGALRSRDDGEDFDRWCCLGVLLSLVVAPEEWEPGDFLTLSRHRKQVYLVQMQSGALPATIAHRLGLSMDEQHVLAHMNDYQFLDFAEIADRIERFIPAGRRMTQEEALNFRMRHANPPGWAKHTNFFAMHMAESIFDTSPLVKALLKPMPLNPMPELKLDFLIAPPPWLTHPGGQLLHHKAVAAYE